MASRTHKRRRLELSSANDHLQGFVAWGKPIAKIEKLSAGQRRITFADRTKLLVDRATIHELAKARGWVDYRRKLEEAPSSKDRRNILKASYGYQKRVLAGALRRLEAGMAVAPPHVAQEIADRIALLHRTRVGSPIRGERPITASVPPHHGPAKTFQVLHDAGIQFRTIKRKGRYYVIPIGAG